MARDLSTFTAHLTAVRDIAAGAGPGVAGPRGRDRRRHRPARGRRARLGHPRGPARPGRHGPRHHPPRRAEGAGPLRPALRATPGSGFDPGAARPHLPAPPGQPGQLVGHRGGAPGRPPRGGPGAGAGGALRAGRSARRGPARALRGAGAPRGAAGRAGARGRGGAAAGGGGGPARGGGLPRREGGRRPGRGVAGRRGRGRARRGPAGARRAPVGTHGEEGHARLSRQLEEWSESLEKASRVAVSQAAAAPEAAPGGAIEPGRPRARRLARAGGRGDRGLGRRGGGPARRAPGPAPALRPAAAPGKGEGGERWRARGRTGSAPPRRRARRRSRSGRGGSTCAGCAWTTCFARWTPSSTGSSPRAPSMPLILHGHGTGALKDALRTHLKGSPYVGAFRRGDPQEGGDAVTVCAFRR